MKHTTLWPGLAGMLALAACNSPPPFQTNCPNVAVLEQGSTLTEFLPGRQDIAAQITKAQITGVAGTCEFVKKKDILKVTFQAGFVATNGPANTSHSLVLPYLVSLSQGNEINGVTYNSIPLKFNGNESTASATTKPITFSLPNTPATTRMDILVSFHLTPDQLAYNNAHPGQ
jgi:hypothetical protein